MSIEWFIARRYLTARRRQAFISLISGVSVVGVGVGVMATVIALAIMTGVQTELRARILGSTAHVYVSKTGGGGFTDVDAELKRMSGPDVIGSSPALLGFGLISSARTVLGLQIKGIDPVRESQVTEIGPAIKSGSFQALAERPQGRLPGLLLGLDFAQRLGVDVGDRVTIITAAQTSNALGMAQVHLDFEVVGTFQFGFYQFDNQTGFVSLEMAEELMGRTGPDMIQLRLRDIDRAQAVSAELQKTLGPGYDVSNWADLNRPLYTALALEKLAISLAIGLIVMVAALNIVASLVLLVMEKTQDIAILRTMGTRAAVIRRIFVFQGLTIGGIGTIAGAVLGVAVSLTADRYQWIKLNGDVYEISYLPFRVHPLDVTVVVLAALGVCLLATLYPSRQAGRIDPAAALRHE